MFYAFIIIILVCYVLIAIRYNKNRKNVYSSSVGKISPKFNIMEDTVVSYLMNKKRNIKGEFKNPRGLRYISMERNGEIILIYCRRNIYRNFIFGKFLWFIKRSELDSFKLDLMKYNMKNKCNARGLFLTEDFSTKSVRNYAELIGIEFRDARRWQKNLKKL